MQYLNEGSVGVRVEVITTQFTVTGLEIPRSPDAIGPRIIQMALGFKIFETRHKSICSSYRIFDRREPRRKKDF